MALASSLEDWLTANTLPNELRGTLISNKILSLEELTELEDSKVEEIGKTIKLVQAKKFKNKCKELRDGADAALFVPPEVILLGTEEAAPITTLKHQLDVENTYLQRIVDFKTDQNHKISSEKARNVLNISHSEHQDRVGRLRQIITTKMKSGIKDPPEVVEPSWKRVDGGSNVRFVSDFVSRREISSPNEKAFSPPASSEEENGIKVSEDQLKIILEKEEKEMEKENNKQMENVVVNPIVSSLPTHFDDDINTQDNFTHNPMVESPPSPIILQPGSEPPSAQENAHIYNDPDKDAPRGWYSIFCCF